MTESVDTGQLNATLLAATEQLSQNQAITFRRYVRLVLPIDGFVFWVNAALVSASTLANLPSRVISGPNTVTAQGSLHYSSMNTQDEDQTIGINRVVFTSSEEIQDFNEIAPDTIFIGEIDEIRFAFSRRGPLYRAAGLWHYEGDAIYAPMETQIIDDLTDFNDTDAVVSNSLPIWLGLNAAFQTSNSAWNVPLYPSFALPDNLAAPYISVHIEPSQTRAIQVAPRLDATLSHYQLCSDRVRLTMYGLRSNDALDFQDQLFQYMTPDDAPIGLMNVPVIRDEKRKQTELNILAQKKTFDLEVSYFQERIRDVSRQFILKAIPTFYQIPL